MMNANAHYISPGELPALLEALASGSEAAFTRLFNYYQPRLLLHVLPFSHSYANAQEAVQETFFKLWTRKETLLGIVALDRYLLRMAKNQLLDIQKKEDIGRRHQNRLQPPIAQGANAEDALSFAEYLESARIAIGQLPQKQQQVFRLRQEDDRTIPEIAALTGMSEEAVYKNLSRAVATVKAALRKHSDWFGLALLLLHAPK